MGQAAFMVRTEFLDAISFISAIIGEEYSSLGLNDIKRELLIVWNTHDGLNITLTMGDYLKTRKQTLTSNAKLQVTASYDLDDGNYKGHWDKIFKIIGYCSLNSISYEVP